MSNAYYLNSLYPLQDHVLQLLEAAKTPFYLTGGTALSRCYLQHRFSDDLDFFVNRRKEFADDTRQALVALRSRKDWTIEVEVNSPDFMRCYVVTSSAKLKLDFVNDITYRFGDVQCHSLFYRVDNLRNMLSNKLGAVGRNEARDMADIVFTCRLLAFSWRDIFNEAQQKDDWVNPLEISRLMAEYDMSRFKNLPWMHDVNCDQLTEEMQKLSREILLGAEHRAN